jgi:hypothetical protein
VHAIALLNVDRQPSVTSALAMQPHVVQLYAASNCDMQPASMSLSTRSSEAHIWSWQLWQETSFSCE